MPPKKGAKNTKKQAKDNQNASLENQNEEETVPQVPQEKPASPKKVAAQTTQNPAQKQPNLQEELKTDDKQASNDVTRKGSQDINKENPDQNSEPVAVIKLNQFNNFPMVAKKSNVISEEEKKRLREMRFAGLNSNANTFEITKVGIFMKNIK